MYERRPRGLGKSAEYDSMGGLATADISCQMPFEVIIKETNCQGKANLAPKDGLCRRIENEELSDIRQMCKKCPHYLATLVQVLGRVEQSRADRQEKLVRLSR